MARVVSTAATAERLRRTVDQGHLAEDVAGFERGDHQPSFTELHSTLDDPEHVLTRVALGEDHLARGDLSSRFRVLEQTPERHVIVSFDRRGRSPASRSRPYRRGAPPALPRR